MNKFFGFAFRLSFGRSLLLASAMTVAMFAITGHAATFTSGAAAIRGSDRKIDRRIYTEIARSNKQDAPVVILLNGLIYEIDRWLPSAKILAGNDVTVIRMSFSAQPESLRLLKNGETPRFLSHGLELSDLAAEVAQVLKFHKITKPVTVVGLSYSGAVATEFAKIYPKKVDKLVLLAPLVVPLDNYNPTSLPLRTMLDSVRFWENAPCLTYSWLNPWLCSSRDYWYDSFYNYYYENFLNMRVSTTPEGIAPALYKKSVFQLVRATRLYNLKTDAPLLKNVHMVIAENDEKNLREDQEKVWKAMDPAERRSLAEFKGVKHALPDEAPKATAEWIESIVKDAPDMQHGEEYVVDP